MDVKNLLSIRDKQSLPGDIIDGSSPTIHELEREAYDDTSRFTSQAHSSSRVAKSYLDQVSGIGAYQI